MYVQYVTNLTPKEAFSGNYHNIMDEQLIATIKK